jgi:hypothetical protein
MCISSYYLYYNLTIPSEIKGWLIMSLITPLATRLLSTSSWISWFRSGFIYEHTWNQHITGNQSIDWISYYLLKNQIYSYDSITKIITDNQSIWWKNDVSLLRPQIYEIPSEWLIFKYNDIYMLAYYPLPSSERVKHEYLITTEITIYSYKKIKWLKFIEDVRDYFYDNMEASKMTIYTVDNGWYTGDNLTIKPIRHNPSINDCFGNPEKEKIWNIIINHLDPENKEYYNKLNLPYHTSVLLYGEPGTGKTELLFRIASFTWAKYQLPIYILNCQGMDDAELESCIQLINRGYILVDEWDMILPSENKKSKKSSKSSKQQEDESNDDNNNDDDNDVDDENDDENKDYPSLKCWLNLLDRVNGEIIFWFTTNNYQKLANYRDGALIRNGRIDHKIQINKMTHHEVKKAFNHFKQFINPNDENIIGTLDNIDDNDLDNLSIADVISCFKTKTPFIEIINNKNKSNIQNMD